MHKHVIIHVMCLVIILILNALILSFSSLSPPVLHLLINKGKNFIFI